MFDNPLISIAVPSATAELFCNLCNHKDSETANNKILSVCIPIDIFKLLWVSALKVDFL